MNTLLLDIEQKPESLFKWALLSLQHVFGMFSATILVPLLTGMDIGIALIASGVGTLAYIFITKRKVPIYLGSSFAYIAAISFAINQSGLAAALVGLMLVGLIYIVVAIILRYSGTAWLNNLLPPVVIGPIIMVIGLSLAYVAIESIGLTADTEGGLFIGSITFITAALIAIKAQGFFKMIPFLIAIIIGYTLSVIMGDVSLGATFSEANFFHMPNFKFIGTYALDFNVIAMFAPLAFVTIAEHIGDHKVLGEITGRDFFKDPGLEKTLLGDGVATFLSASMGGPANTSYGENTGIIALNRIGSVHVIMGAAFIAIALGFSGYVHAFILSIPDGIIGGITIILYGLIASNGIKVLSKNNVDLNTNRNLIIVSSILVIGLGGAVIEFSAVASMSGMSLAAVVGIVLNKVLPKTA